MRSLLLLTVVTVSAGAPAGDKLYKCADARGRTEYSSVACKGEVFDPAKGRGSVTNVKMPKAEAAPAVKSGTQVMTPEQKQQMEELGIKPGGAAQMKSLTIPKSWLK